MSLLLVLTGCAGLPDAARTPSPTTSVLPSPSPSPSPSAGTPTPTAAPASSPSQTPRATPTPSDATVKGLDVSRYNPRVDWAGLAASGHRFVFVKATEGTSHVSPTHTAQRTAAKASRMFHGAYHYARPAASSGRAQAAHFVAHGGAWTPDGRTLPGALDLEAATTADPCHGLSVARMQRWIADFSAEYRRLSGRLPVIYVKAEMWNGCVGGSVAFADHPLWLYDHEGGPGPLPTGWARPTFWQRGIEANLDRNVFFGTEADLAAFALTG